MQKVYDLLYNETITCETIMYILERNNTKNTARITELLDFHNILYHRAAQLKLQVHRFKHMENKNNLGLLLIIFLSLVFMGLSLSVMYCLATEKLQF